MQNSQLAIYTLTRLDLESYQTITRQESSENDASLSCDCLETWILSGVSSPPVIYDDYSAPLDDVEIFAFLRQIYHRPENCEMI